jgi:hypothetical protein
MKKILSLFGIKPAQKKNFLWICTPFATSVILILIATGFLCIYSFLTEINDKVNTLQNLFIKIITVISNLLVVANTSIFAYVSPKITVIKPNNSVTEKPNNASSLCNLLNLATFGVAFILFWALVYNNSIYLISILSIIIFSLFIAADNLFIKYLDECINRETDQHSLENFKVKKSVMKKALALIDFAGFFGSLIILIMSWIFLFFADNNFIQGFGIGALAFHIIFTQFNWAYLKTDELIKLAQI